MKVLRCLGPEQTGQGELGHSRLSSSGESEVEDHGEEAPVESPLEQADQAETRQRGISHKAMPTSTEDSTN